MSEMPTASKIYVAGHQGMVGSAIVRRLTSDGHDNVALRNRQELDLTDQHAVQDFFASERPDYVFLAAAKVGGIHANKTYPAEFIRDNLAIQTNVIHSAWKCGIKKLLFLGSSCIYPRDCPQPMREEYLLSGPLETTNEAYAVAKIAGIKMCEAYRQQYGFNAISAMPTNLYGPGDNYHAENSHVVPGLIRRIQEAKTSTAPEVVIWGSGRPLREFMHVDDLADAAVFLMRQYCDAPMVNVGSGCEVSIAELAGIISNIIGYEGRLVFDTNQPDGTPRKRLCTRRMEALGWKARIALDAGLRQTIQTFVSTAT